jgi:ABC-type lipoprotein release transport system permease subunit
MPPALILFMTFLEAFLGALLGALYPSWRASGFDPVDALAFE